MIKLEFNNPYYNLRNLIEDLEKTESKLKVIITTLLDDTRDTYVDTGYENIQHPYASWRGVYSLLSLQYTNEKNDLTVKDFLEMTKECLTREYRGYKGGSFYMDEFTPIYIANYGKCDYMNSKTMRLVGIKVEDDLCRLVINDDPRYD